MTRAERLRAYCSSVDGRPVTWGCDDCSTWALQWVVDETGREVDWPRYDTRDEAMAKIDEAGGLLPLWDAMAAKLGLPEFIGLHGFPLVAPPLGSVGIIETSHHGQIGVIFADALVGCARMDVLEGEGPGVRMIGLRPRTIVKVWTLE